MLTCNLSRRIVIIFCICLMSAVCRAGPGDLDTSFGTGGVVTTGIIGPCADSAYAVAIQPDGKILAAGYFYNEQSYDFALTRYNTDGSLDTGFGNQGQVTTDFDSSSDKAYAIAIQPDSKIVLAGYSGLDFALARYNSDGSLDTGFGTSGLLVTDFNAGNDHAYAITIQADGKIVVAGISDVDFGLARYNSSDGSLDTSFDTDGLVTTDFNASSTDAAYAVVIQGDDKIVVAGVSNGNFALARYNGSDGSLDTSFDTDGLVTTDFPSDSYDIARGIGIHSGKIVLTGYTYNGTDYDFALARYNSSDGSLDTGFDTDGLVTTDFGSSDSRAYAMAIQADGQIVAAGHAVFDYKTYSDFALARYNSSNGSLDSTFGTGGKVTTDFLGPSENYGMDLVAIQADDKIVVAGYAVHLKKKAKKKKAHLEAEKEDPSTTFDDLLLARYNPDGDLDSSFGSSGTVSASIDTSDVRARAIAIQDDGKLIVAGDSLNYDSSSYEDFALARYTSDGGLDATFGTGGLVTTDFASDYDAAWDVAIQADGKVVVAGFAWSGSDWDFALARYNKINGSLDTGFGSGGLVITDFGSSYDLGYAVLIQDDDKILAAGISDDDFALARYNSNGSLDTDFGSDGLVITDFGSSADGAYAVALQNDGKIVAAGASKAFSYFDFALARYNSNGSLDTEFGSEGLVITDFNFDDDYAYAVAIQCDGKITAAGYTYNGTDYDFALACYNTDGSLDTGFGSGGLVTTDLDSGSDDQARGIGIQLGGKIVLAGYIDDGTNTDLALTRYLNYTLSDADGDGLGDLCDPCPSDHTNTCNPDRSGSGVVDPGESTIISTADGSITITVPPGALDKETTITITDSGNGTEFGLATSGGNGVAYYMVNIEPSGLEFNKNFPVTITFRWPDDEEPYGTIDGTNLDEADLVIIKEGKEITGRCGQSGSRPGESCNMEGNFFSVQVASLSDFALWQMVSPAGLLGGWGNDNFSQVSDAPPGTYVGIAAGAEHSLGLRPGGAIEGWGSNGWGQCNVPDVNDFAAVAAGIYHSLALKTDGSIIGWGRNDYGQATPPDGDDYIAIAGGKTFGLALKNNGTLTGWGVDPNSMVVVSIPDGNDFVAVSAGFDHGLALRKDGSLAAWGDDTFGQVANTPADSNYTAISAGWYHNLALRADGSITGWGRNGYNQATVPDSNATDIVAVSAGGYHSLALKENGSIVAWGQDISGQATPPAAHNFIAIAAGGWHNLAMYQCRPTLTADLTGDCYVDLKDLAAFCIQWLDCGNPFDDTCVP